VRLKNVIAINHDQSHKCNMHKNMPYVILILHE